METNWENLVFVVCHEEAFPGALAALDIAFPTDDGTPRDSTNPRKYGTKLSGQAGTFYGAAFAVTEQKRLTLEGAGLAATPGIFYWRCSNPGAVLESTNFSGSTPAIGQAWSMEACLSALGLTVANE